jgi:mannose-6-phosphate isomerase-like protein (cupin superfamily)
MLSPAQQAGKDPAIDLRFGDWHDSAPRQIRGSLVERDILTRGDRMNPPRKGAVLDHINSFTYGTLAPGASITPTRLDKQQEIYYFLSGSGKMTAAGETADLYRGITILMPAGLEFRMTNNGKEPLTMYIINEPIPAGFTPNAKMLVRDENTLRISGDDPGRHGGGTTGHWAHVVKTLFTKKDGLGTLGNILTVALDPLTLGEPHVHHPNSRETWTAIEGTSLAFVSNELRWMPPGMGYMIRPDDNMTHSNINVGDKQVKFLFF